MIKNEGKGSVYYGMHFYPGCAEYAEPNQKPYRVFLNDNTIRSMGPSFEGRPVFVLHVDEVQDDLNRLRSEADGWVVESFYNQADGKHWVKFITTSDKAAQAIKSGMKLSNCYIPKSFANGGTWNGITYEREITAGEYDHLAIVPNPRYEESIILNPDQFKEYNERKLIELKKLANHKQGESVMKLSWFKKQKVENSTELETMCVVLPKSGLEVEVAKLLNEADEREMKKKEPQMADLEHLVELKGKKMSVKELMNEYDAMCSKNESDDDSGSMDPAMNDDQGLEYASKEVPMSEDDKEAEKQAMALMKEEKEEIREPKQNEEDDEEEKKKKKKEAAEAKKNAKEKADRLRNANNAQHIPEVRVSLSSDRVARGIQLFGSDN